MTWAEAEELTPAEFDCLFPEVRRQLQKWIDTRENELERAGWLAPRGKAKFFVHDNRPLAKVSYTTRQTVIDSELFGHFPQTGWCRV